MSTPEGWEGILEDGETILWQGRPVTGIKLGDFFGFHLIFGLIFSGFSLTWITIARVMTRDESFALFPFFGIPFLLVGLFIVFGLPFTKDYVRKHSWYTLSDRKAYIATDFFGKKRLKSVTYADMNVLELEDDSPGSITFRRDVQVSRSAHRSRNGGHGHRTRTTVTTTGFERIEDARAVYRMISARRDTPAG